MSIMNVLDWVRNLSFYTIGPEIFWLSCIIILFLFYTLFRKSARYIIGGILFLLLVSIPVYVSLYGGVSLHLFQEQYTLDGFSTLGFIFIVLALLLLSLSVLPEYDMNEDWAAGTRWFLFTLSVGFSLYIMTATKHLFIAFIALELLAFGFYLMIGMTGLQEHKTRYESAVKYFFLGSFASAFFLFGTALIYGMVGQLSFPQIRSWVFSVSEGDALWLFRAGLLFVFMGLAFKLSIVPFHMWTPDVYQGAYTPIAGFMSVTVKFSAFVVLYRVYIEMLAPSEFWAQHGPFFFFFFCILTATVGNFYALGTRDAKRLLAYSSIAHAGFMLLAFVDSSVQAREALLYYLFVYLAMNVGAFTVVSWFEKEGKDTTLDAYRGALRTRFFPSIFLVLFLLSLAGIPLTGGFLAKVFILNVLIKSKMYFIVLLALLNMILSAYYYMRWIIILSGQPQGRRLLKQNAKTSPSHMGFVIVLVFCTFLIFQFGLFPATFLNFIRSLPFP